MRLFVNFTNFFYICVLSMALVAPQVSAKENTKSTVNNTNLNDIDTLTLPLPPLPIKKTSEKELAPAHKPLAIKQDLTQASTKKTKAIVTPAKTQEKHPQSPASAVQLYKIAHSYSSNFLKCELYSSLAILENFELKDLALMRAIETCKKPKKGFLKKFWALNTKKSFKWAYSQSRPLALKLAHKMEDHRRIVFYTERLLPRYSSRKKIQLIEKMLPSLQNLIEANSGKLKDRYIQKKKARETQLKELALHKMDTVPEAQWFQWARSFKKNGQEERAKEIYQDIIANNWQFTPMERFKAHIEIRQSKKKKFLKKKSKANKRRFLTRSKRLMQLAVNIIENENITDIRDKLYLSKKGPIEYFSDVNYYRKSTTKTRKAIKKYLKHPKVVGLYKADVYRYLTRISWMENNWKRAYKESQRAVIAILDELGAEPNLSKVQPIIDAIEQSGWYSSRKYRNITSLYQQLLWQYAFSARVTKRYKKSNSILKAILNIVPHSPEQEILIRRETEFMHLKALFWLGKNHLSLGQRGKAYQYLNKVITQSDDHWYTAWAHDILRKKIIPFPKGPAETVPQIPKNISLAELRVIKLLQSVGENYLAKRLIKTKLPNFSPNLKNIKAGKITDLSPVAMQLRESVGDFRSNISAYNYSLDFKAQKNYLQTGSAFIYPTPFSEIVDKALKKFKNMFSGFAYAIMRQESRFVIDAKSPVGARGLMQVMPRTAKSIHTELGLPYGGKSDLLDPEVNIPMGVGYLSRWLKNFDNSFILTTLGYNGGPNNAKKWFRKYYDGDYHEFHEKIPFKETRHYLGVVTSNYIGYLRRSKTKPFLFPTLLKRMPRK